MTTIISGVHIITDRVWSHLATHHPHMVRMTAATDLHPGRGKSPNKLASQATIKLIDKKRGPKFKVHPTTMVSII